MYVGVLVYVGMSCCVFVYVGECWCVFVNVVCWAVFDPMEVVRLRQQGYSWRAIASQLGFGAGTVRRAYQALMNSSRSDRDAA